MRVEGWRSKFTKSRSAANSAAALLGIPAKQTCVLSSWHWRRRRRHFQFPAKGKRRRAGQSRSVHRGWLKVLHGADHQAPGDVAFAIAEQRFGENRRAVGLKDFRRKDEHQTPLRCPCTVGYPGGERKPEEDFQGLQVRVHDGDPVVIGIINQAQIPRVGGRVLRGDVVAKHGGRIERLECKPVTGVDERATAAQVELIKVLSLGHDDLGEHGEEEQGGQFSDFHGVFELIV